MNSWINFVIRFRWLVIALTLLVTVGLGSQIRHLQVIINADNMLPQSNHYIVAGNEIEKTFGGKYTVVIGVTARNGTIYQPEVLAKVKRITDRLMETPGVLKTTVNGLAARKAKSIQGTADGMVVHPLMEQVPQTAAEMEALKRAVASNPVYLNLVVSPDQKTTQIVADFHELSGGMKDIDAAVQKVVAPEKDASVDVTVSGLVIYLAWLEQFSARIAFLLPAAILIVGLIHFEAFRTVQALVLPLVTALLAVVWAVSFLAISGRPMDVFNSSTPILILAIAAGHAVQILKRYYEEFARLKDASPGAEPKTLSRQAVATALTKVGPVMIVACVVAAIGFLSLTVFEIKAVRTFGIFSALGVLSALVLELTFIPALRATLPAPSEKEYLREKKVTVWDRLVRGLYSLVLTRRRLIYMVSVLVVVVLGAGVYQMKVENSQKSYFSGNIPVKIDDAKLNERMAGTNTLYMMIDTGAVDGVKDPRILRAMEAIQTHLAQNHLVGKTVSIGDFIKRMNQAMNGDDPAQFRLPADQGLVAQYLFLYANSGEPGDFDTYVDYDYRKAVIQIYFKSDDSIALTAVARDTQAFADKVLPAGVKARIGSGIISSLALNEEMVRTKILNIAQIFLSVFLVSSLIFRSPVAGALIIIPLAATVLLNFGIMGYFGIPMNIPNSLVAAMAVGIGADYAIYLCFRMREELKSHHSEADALRTAFLSAGKAALFVSTAVAGGFSVLLFSIGFNVHLWMGILIMAAMLISSFSTLTLFAALLLTLRPKFIFQPGQTKEALNAVPTL